MQRGAGKVQRRIPNWHRNGARVGGSLVTYLHMKFGDFLTNWKGSLLFPQKEAQQLGFYSRQPTPPQTNLQIGGACLRRDIIGNTMYECPSLNP